MGKIYLLASDQLHESPTLAEIIAHTQDPVFELVFQSSRHNASLVVRAIDQRVGFWFFEHEAIEFGKYYYNATGTGRNWVSVLPEDSLELVNVFDGQDYNLEPRMFYVDHACLKPVLEWFVDSGTRSELIHWELERDVVERLGSRGCFEDIE